MTTQAGLLLVLLATLAGCGPSGVDAARADRCADLTNQINAWVANHNSCNADDDCVGEAAYGPLFATRTPPGGDISCWPQEVLSKDGESGYRSLLGQLDDAKCDGPTQICSGSVPVPACRNHVCTSP